MHSITEYRARKCRNFKRASLCCLACPHGRRCRNRFADHRTMFRRRDRKRTLAEPIRCSLVILSRARQPVTSVNWPTPALKTPLRNIGKKRIKTSRSCLHRMTSDRQKNVSNLVSNSRRAALKTQFKIILENPLDRVPVELTIHFEEQNRSSRSFAFSVLLLRET